MYVVYILSSYPILLVSISPEYSQTSPNPQKICKKLSTPCSNAPVFPWLLNTSSAAGVVESSKAPWGALKGSKHPEVVWLYTDDLMIYQFSENCWNCLRDSTVSQEKGVIFVQSCLFLRKRTLPNVWILFGYNRSILLKKKNNGWGFQGRLKTPTLEPINQSFTYSQHAESQGWLRTIQTKIGEGSIHRTPLTQFFFRWMGGMEGWKGMASIFAFLFLIELGGLFFVFNLKGFKIWFGELNWEVVGGFRNGKNKEWIWFKSAKNSKAKTNPKVVSKQVQV